MNFLCMSDADKIKKLLSKLEQNAEKHRAANEDLLGHIGAKTVPNAKRKLDAERREFEQTKEQLCHVVDALEVDNWRNAVVRAKSLLNKLEQNRMPKWLLTVSPAWPQTVRPSQYKYWLRFCQEQFLLLLSELEMIAETDPEFDVEEQLEKARVFYFENEPGKFVQEVADFLLGDYEFERAIVDSKPEVIHDVSTAELMRSLQAGTGKRAPEQEVEDDEN